MEASRPLKWHKEVSMDWEWVGLVGTLVGILSAWLGYQKGIKKESKSEGQKAGVLQTDITYIKENIDKLLDEQKASNENVKRLTERVITMETSKVSIETFNKLSEIVARLDEKFCAHMNTNSKGGN